MASIILVGRETTALSGGEQAKAGVAVLSLRSQGILLDSPLEQLDLMGRHDFCCDARFPGTRGQDHQLLQTPLLMKLRDHVERFLLIEDGRIALVVPVSGLTVILLSVQA